MIKLSALVPSIRINNLPRLYESIRNSFSGSFEFIIIGPYEPTLKENNVKWIQSWRSPCASQQEGLIQAQGEYISWFSDDGEALPGMIDESFKLLDEINVKYHPEERYRTIIVSKYQEGNDPNNLSYIQMCDDKYYYLNHHDSMRLGGVPSPAMVLNCGLVSRRLCLELGGWAADTFQALPLAFNDFSIRAFKYGANWVLQEKPVFKCSHEPDMTGTHGPIHIGQTVFDTPVFNKLYTEVTDRCVIDMDNYLKSPVKWDLRFGK